jgi:MHS family alpha-ketoglutarate permease-like MFS transporter
MTLHADAPAVRATAEAARPTALGTRIRSVVGGSIGNLIEWYDWLVYSAFSLYFAKAFFPSDSQTAQLLNTAAVFAVGYLMRPLGAWAIGLYADRSGRKAALTLSVMMMCVGSLIIALTPGYGTIGVAAPALLIVARLLQGLSVGGEYGTSATYLTEMAPPKWRGFYASFHEVTLLGGQLIAVIVLVLLQQLLLTPAELDGWGWRIPFFLGAGFAVGAFYLRRGLAETHAFDVGRRHQPRENLLKVLARHPREIAIVAGLTLGGTVAVYTYTVYMQKFLVNTGGISRSASSLISGATLIFFMVLQPIVGALSDRIGRRPVLIAFGVLGTLSTVPIMTAISRTHDAWTALALILIGLVIVSGYTAVNAAAKAELFPTEVRALGVNLPYALTVALFGGTTEYAGLWFKQVGFESGFYWYVSSCILVSLIVYLVMPETRSRDIEQAVAGAGRDDGAIRRG